MLAKLLAFFRWIILPLSLFIMALWLFSASIIQLALEQVYQDKTSEITVANAHFNALNFNLVIKGLTIKQQQTVLAIDDFVADINVPALFKKQIIFEKLQWRQGVISIAQQQQQFTIAGFSLPSNQKTKTSKDSTTNIDWTIQIPQLAIENLTLTANLNGKKQTSVIESFTLHDIEFHDHQLTSTALLSALVNDQVINADITLTSKNQQLVVLIKQLTGTFNHAGLSAWLPPTIKQIQANYQIDGTIALALNTETAVTSNLNVLFNDIRYEDEHYRTSLDQLTFKHLSNKLTLSKDWQVTIAFKEIAFDRLAFVQQQSTDIPYLSFNADALHLHESDIKLAYEAQQQATQLTARLSFTGDKVTLVNEQKKIALDATTVQTADLTAILTPELQLNAKIGAIELTGLQVTDDVVATQMAEQSTTETSATTVPQLIAHIGDLLLNQLSLTFDHKQQANFAVANLKADNIEVSKPDANLPALTALSQLKVTNIQGSHQHIAIEAILVSDAIVQVLKGSSGQINNLIAILQPKPQSDNQVSPMASSTEKEQTIAPTSNTTEQQSKFQYAIDSIQFEGQQQLVWQDDSVAPSVHSKLTLAQLALMNVSNVKPEPMQITAQGVIDEFATVSVDSELSLTTNDFRLDSKIKGLDLIPYSPYLAAAGGYAVKAGQFNGDLTLTAKNNRLKGLFDIKVKGIALSETASVKQQKLDTAVPLNLAIEQLTDSQGNFAVEIPISGALDKVNVSSRGFLQLLAKKVLVESTKSYLIQTFVPYANVANLALFLANKALQQTVDDLIYEPTQITVAQSEQPKLSALAEKLKQQPKLQLVICPKMVSADIGVQAKTLTEQQQQQLRRVGLQRARQLIHYMKKQQIDTNRFVLCSPELTSAEKPTLTFIVH
jgi:hypothetical protein